MDIEGGDKGDKGGARMSLNSLGTLFCDTWKIYKERWQVLVEIVLLPTLVTALGYVLMSIGFPFTVVGGVVIFIGWVAFAFSILPVVYSIHNSTGVDASYKATIGWFWPFVWVGILGFFAVLGGAIMLIIPGIWLAFALSLAAYVFVIERRRGIDALRQSKDYVAGYWWAVAGRVLLLGICWMVAVVVVEIAFTVLAGRIGGSIAYLAMVLFFIPYSAIYHYLILQNLRERKPALATEEKKTGGGFITASAIVGVAVPVVVLVLLIVFGAVGAVRTLRREGRYAPPPEYGIQGD